MGRRKVESEALGTSRVTNTQTLFKAIHKQIITLRIIVKFHAEDL